MEKSQIFFIQNPVAGASNPESIAQNITAFTESAGCKFFIHKTSRGENLTSVINAAVQEGYNRFIAVGGDGTVSNAANALINRSIPFGIIPSGSGNVLARDLGIPFQIKNAVALAVEGQHTSRIDAMKIDNRHYFLNIGVGLTARAIRETRREEKRIFSWAAYLFSGLKLLSRSRKNLIEMKIDGETQIIQASEVIITNAGIIGFELLRWGMEVKPGDGILDVFAFDAFTINDLLRLGWKMVTRSTHETSDITHFRVRDKVAVRTNRRLPMQADGEAVGYTPFEVQVLPKALQIIVPDKKTGEA